MTEAAITGPDFIGLQLPPAQSPEQAPEQSILGSLVPQITRVWPPIDRLSPIGICGTEQVEHWQPIELPNNRPPITANKAVRMVRVLSGHCTTPAHSQHRLGGWRTRSTLRCASASSWS
jgi:hypothetical protein